MPSHIGKHIPDNAEKKFLNLFVFLLLLLYIRRFLYFTNHYTQVPMDQETGVQSQVKSYQRLKKMVLDAALLNTQQYKVRFKGKWSNPGNGVAPSPIPQCHSYWKGHQLYFFTLYIYIYPTPPHKQDVIQDQFLRGVTVNRWIKKFCLGCKNLNNKIMYSMAALQAIETNLVSKHWRVSGKLSISVLFDTFSTFAKVSVTHITKILQNFWFTLEI